MSESALQRPVLTQTARGGKRMAMRPRNISPEQHILGDFMCSLLMVMLLKLNMLLVLELRMN